MYDRPWMLYPPTCGGSIVKTLTILVDVENAEKKDKKDI
jgi:hypothetical protein